MIPRINMSAGEFFDLIRPLVMLISAFLSTWVLVSARKRFPLYVALAWAIGTLLLPLIALPIYWCVILFWRRLVHSPRHHALVPLIYGLILILGITYYFYQDQQTADAHLARATQAKLVDDTGAAITEYKRALALEDDPHTHKLLAVEFAQAGYLTEAISEFRLAQQGGEPDDLIHYNLGLLLERLNQLGQARLEFESFLRTETCLRGDMKCDSARDKLNVLSTDER